jgi:hypothetical protein
VFDNIFPGKIFLLRKREVTGGCRKLHNKDLHNLFSSPDIIRVTKGDEKGIY